MTRPFPELPPCPEVYEGIALGPNQRPPYPGSAEAIAVGCLCGVFNRTLITYPPNDYGQFMVRGDCPLHGVAEARSDQQMRLA